MTIQIKKVKLRDAMFGTIEYDEVKDISSNQVVKVCNDPVHEDFKAAIKALAVHAVLICELVDVTKVKGDLDDYKPSMLQYITVKGVSINHGDSAGVTISFERKLSTGRVINMNTPFTKFNDDSVVYKFDDDLQLAISDLEKEVTSYLLDEKYGEGAQLDMVFNKELAEEDAI